MALCLRDESAWSAFLAEAGIPTDDCDKYAAIFVKKRLTEKSAGQLTILGDVLAILGHIKTLDEHKPSLDSVHSGPVPSKPSLVTKQANPAVHRMNFGNIINKRTNPFRTTWFEYRHSLWIAHSVVLSATQISLMSTSKINSYEVFTTRFYKPTFSQRLVS